MKFRYWTRAELIRGDFFLSIYICIYLIILFFLLLLFLFFFFLFFLLFLFFFSLIFFCIITGLVPAAASSKSSVSSSSAVLGKVLRAGGDTLLVGLGDNRYCERIRRPHKSNGVYLAVDTASRTFDQRCHDPDCSVVRVTNSNFELLFAEDSVRSVATSPTTRPSTRNPYSQAQTRRRGVTSRRRTS
eukprot:GHVU01190708.1.p1 GENE.GHVU01190708.1~~GHVU01190708.1.p1  ORF type:complete len:187 (+),score=14.71 GHVU01190708.1:552-1112(+)